MFYVTNYTFAVCLCVVCMLCWGSWGNTQKLVGKSWRFELFYWDYVIGLLAFALAMGLTLGSCGENHIISRPATAARIRPFFVEEALDEPADFALNASALQMIETTMIARPETIRLSGLPPGAIK